MGSTETPAGAELPCDRLREPVLERARTLIATALRLEQEDADRRHEADRRR